MRAATAIAAAALAAVALAACQQALSDHVGGGEAAEGWVAPGVPAGPGARSKVRPLRLVVVGDVFPSGSAGAWARRNGHAYPWARVGARLRRADIAVANLEGVVATVGRPVPGKELHFRAPPAFLRQAVERGGLDVVSLANNHSLDFGRRGLLATIRNARRAGLATVGAGRNLDEALRPAIVSRGGLRVAFVAANDVVPSAWWNATPHEPGAAPADPELVAAAVRRARREADLVVVLVHWGLEYTTAPIGRQREIAAAALGAGATAVIGAHPHVLQPIERRGSRLVAWSLGNFVFRVTTHASAETGALELDLGARGVIRHRFRPARIVRGRPVWR